MRTSKKGMLIEKALEIVEKRGLEALTYESLAAASGLSKSGLIYHFPSREALIRQINEHLVRTWEADLIATAGAPAEELDMTARLRALLTVLSRNATRADLLFTLDAVAQPQLREIWEPVIRRWSVDIAEHPRYYLLTVLADGLWVHDHINPQRLTTAQRQALIDAAWELLA